jgi:hypothetical protein
MVELQLQIVRKTCNQNLGLTILAVKDRNEHAVLVGEVTPRSCSALGGLRVRYFLYTLYHSCLRFTCFGLEFDSSI